LGRLFRPIDRSSACRAAQRCQPSGESPGHLDRRGNPASRDQRDRSVDRSSGLQPRQCYADGRRAVLSPAAVIAKAIHSSHRKARRQRRALSLFAPGRLSPEVATCPIYFWRASLKGQRTSPQGGKSSALELGLGVGELAREHVVTRAGPKPGRQTKATAQPAHANGSAHVRLGGENRRTRTKRAEFLQKGRSSGAAKLTASSTTPTD